MDRIWIEGKNKIRATDPTKHEVCTGLDQGWQLGGTLINNVCKTERAVD